MQKQKLTAAGCSYLVKLCKNANMCNHHSRSVIEKQSKYCILFFIILVCIALFLCCSIKTNTGKKLVVGRRMN